MVSGSVVVVVVGSLHTMVVGSSVVVVVVVVGPHTACDPVRHSQPNRRFFRSHSLCVAISMQSSALPLLSSPAAQQPGSSVVVVMAHRSSASPTRHSQPARRAFF